MISRLLVWLIVGILASHAQAQTKVGGYSKTIGNSKLGVTATAGVSVAKSGGGVTDVMNGSHTGKIFNHTKVLASMDFPASSAGGGSAHPIVKANNSIVFAANFGASNANMSVNPTYTEFNGYGSTVSVGPFSVGVNVGVGMTSTGWASWTFGSNRADAENHFLQACSVQGRVSASVLGGLASLTVTVNGDLLNRAGHLSTGDTRITGLPNAHASVQLAPWALKLKLKVHVLFIDWSNTLVDHSGPVSNTQLF